jgi:hypothetical protein
MSAARTACNIWFPSCSKAKASERLNDGVLPQRKVMEYSTKIASGRYRDRDIGGHLTRHRHGHGRPPE